jgi:prepilin-type N-terminal cleavage/methylation domain-containing protein
MSQNRSTGFTLIELLVVISIMSLLSSIVIASVKSARDKAKIGAGQVFGSHVYQVYGAEAAGIWNFDEGSGTTIYDTSGNSNNGTLSGAYSWVNGMNGKAVSFNTVGVSVGNKTVYDSSQFTVAFWIMPNAINPSSRWYNIIMGREVYLNSGFRIALNPDGAVYFWTTESGGNIQYASTDKTVAGQFAHVAVTYDGTKATTYINGKHAGTQTGTYIIPTGATFRINSGGGLAFSNSTFDEVRYYTQSLTAQSIQKMYAQGVARHFALNQ